MCVSCNHQTKHAGDNNTIEITDYYNRKVIISRNSQRIVSLSPGISELIFDLQSGKRLIGRTDYCTFPSEIKNIPSIGGISNANVEKIISLKPDLIISSSMISKSELEQIERASIPVVALPERNSLEGVYETIRILGKILGQDSLAELKISEMKQRIKAITKQNSNNDDGKRPKVYYVVGFGSGGDFSAGGNTYIDNIITLAGGDNIAKNSRNWTFSKEELFYQNPDFVFIRREDYNQFIKTKPYNSLSAVKNGKVFPVESSLIDCQTIRSVEIIEIISDIIHKK
jgi:iron complex transport system substrate-binding protein